ncbi:hypothetical protein IEO21_03232 [Rhodonia placenta]|uniref:Cleavage stimulation factor subunit 2 hinge domain-containing protein n=1 Tax=Rhodonia placenta TaxID=104341 RepID=A0A8H7P6M4_9APHY|nr:hypothetical protein IEO21_03232 [Postia placenta]
MSSQAALQEDQLLELLLQLKKTTPEQARVILNSQPQIAYALMAVMVNVNAVNMDVIQKTLASYGALPGAPSTSQAPPPAAPVSVPAASAIPPHLVSQPPHRGATPTYPSQPPSYPSGGYPAPAFTPSAPQLNAPAGPSGPASYSQPPQAPAGMIPPALAPALANIPDDQRALILRVISMTREEIYQLPYAERENIIKLRATLGLQT